MSTAAPERFRVGGMDCASCARTVEKVVAGLDGVREAHVSFGTSMLVVDGDVEHAAVEAAVRRAGYARPRRRRSRRPRSGGETRARARRSPRSSCC